MDLVSRCELDPFTNEQIIYLALIQNSAQCQCPLGGVTAPILGCISAAKRAWAAFAETFE